MVRLLPLALAALSAVAPALAAAVPRSQNFDLPMPLPLNTAPGTHTLPFPRQWYSLAAALAQGAYCDVPNIGIGYKVGDAKVLARIGDGAVHPHALVYHSKSLGVVLAYQGTNQSSLPSLLYDAQFFWDAPAAELDLPSQAWIDYGLQAAWKSTWSEVKQLVHEARNQYPGANLTITGHSLGASSAILAALALGNETVKTVITFGQPRMGTKDFADTVDARFGPSRLNYVTNGDDIVPHLIPKFVGPPYPQHFSGNIWINPANATLESHGVSATTFYPGQENVNGPISVDPQDLSQKDHLAYYMGTYIAGRGEKNCPVTVGSP